MSLVFGEKFDFVEYFEQCALFLTQNKWIFETANTKFVQAGILESIPKLWISDLDSVTVEELNQIPLGYVNESWSEEFCSFLDTLRRLTVNYDRLEAYTAKEPRIKGVSRKKMYEIENLTSVVGKICDQNEFLLDFGSGLGYFSQNLFSRHNFTVLGIEGDSYRVAESQRRQSILFPGSYNFVQFHQHFIERNSLEYLRTTVTATFKHKTEPNLAIVGLHACADLSIAAINMFLSEESVTKIVIMPCCYHKLKPANDDCTIFHNFPVSDQLREILSKSSCSFIGRPFLRLGCQQTSARWQTMSQEQHELHGKSMFERSLAEAILDVGEFVKVNKLNADEKDLLRKFSLFHESDATTSIPWTTKHIERYNKLAAKYPRGDRLAEYLTCFQTCLQSVKI
ncbi:uncharacterized protein LOC129726162 isoform X2 [Wyeomyia smithii]|uniref:uncharacterized protein LOC129726162 isoform X2 n=1 Tax=Wyeomyia smithii TaxID=174621 RepID=UPI002467E8CA|nr:uncharacterized protein LOC129726162 isoform X2 [Wyeomyia smithii]